MRLPFHLVNLVGSALPSRCHAARRWTLRAAGGSIAKSVNISAAVRFYGRFVEIGEDTWIGPECAFFSSAEAFVTLGARCDIGPGVWFVTGSHEIAGETRRAGRGHCKKIEIGDGCWLGARTVVLGGAKLGTGVVVAAGSVVLPGEIPCNTLIAGVPAKVKKKLDG